MFGRWFASMVDASARHPRATLAIALLLSLLSVLALTRARVDSTLSGMLGGHNPAAESLARIADDFQAAEDLLILVSLPEEPGAASQPTPDDVQRLLAYTERLRGLIEASPDARAAVIAIRDRPDPAIATFIRESVIPAGLFYLDDASLPAFIQRLGPDSVREQLAQNEVMLATPGPGASVLSKQLIKDPLRLREFLQARMASLPADSSAGPELSDDRRSLLIRVSGARPVNDIPFSKWFTATIRELADRANTDRLTVELAGGYAVAAHSATVIRSDAISNTISSVIILYIFFIIVYRGLLEPVMIVVAASVGLLFAFAARILWNPSITPITGALASMLAGLGVDYGIHLRSHHHHLVASGVDNVEASSRAARELAGPLFAAFITTIAGFATVGLGEVRMLKDFALLGSIGLTGALIAILTMLPAMLSLTRRGPRAAARPDPFISLVGRFIGWAASHRRLCLTFSLLILAAGSAGIAATPGLLPPFETDTTVMHPRPNPPLDTGEHIRQRFHNHGDTFFIHLKADSADHLTARAHDVASALNTPAAHAAGIRSTLGLASLLPDPRTTSERAAFLSTLDAEALIAGVRRAFEDSSFNPASFEAYFTFLRSLLLNRRAPSLADVESTPALARLLLPSPSAREKTDASHRYQTVILVTTTPEASHREARSDFIAQTRDLLAPIPGATLTGVTVVGHDLESAARRDLARFSMLSTLLVVAWLLLLFSKPLDVLLALAPVLFAAVCLFGLMSVTRDKLNTVNIVAMPLLAGLAVDSGIFLVATARRAAAEGRDVAAALRPTIHAILCTTVTTLLGFGTLVWTHTPAIQSLGRASMLGITASLIGSLFFVLPILLRARPAPQDPS